MKSLSLIVAALMSASAAFAGGTGEHSHDEMEVGRPGIETEVTRTINVRMYETEDGEYLYEPRDLAIKAGETIRFVIVNDGESPHEFVLDTMPKNEEHKALMEKFPEMEHEDPNAVRLEPGKEGTIIWTFENSGDFEFACLIPGHYEAGMFTPVAVN